MKFRLCSAALFLFFSVCLASAPLSVTNEVTNKKLKLEDEIEQATSLLRNGGYTDSASIERFSTFLLSIKADLQSNSPVVEFSKALASYVCDNEARISELDSEMIDSALLLMATSGTTTTEHKAALHILAQTFDSFESEKSFLLKSATLIDPSTFIFPINVYFKNNFFNCPAAVNAVEAHLSAVLEKHSSDSNLANVHLFEFLHLLHHSRILLSAGTREALYIHFLNVAEHSTDLDFVRKCAQDLLRFYPVRDLRSKVEIQKKYVQKLIGFLICDRVLGLLFDSDLYSAHAFFVHLKESNSLLYKKKVARLVTEKEFINRADGMKNGVLELTDICARFMSSSAMFSLIYGSMPKSEILAKLRRIFSEPKGVYLAEGAKDMQFFMILEYEQILKNPKDPNYEVILCLVFETSAFLFQNTPNDYKNLSFIYAMSSLHALIRLNASRKTTRISEPSFIIGNDAFIEGLWNFMFEVSNSLTDQTFLPLRHVVDFVAVLRRHTNPSWSRLTIARFFAYYLVSSRLNNWEKAFQLHKLYPEIDAFCLMMSFSALIGAKRGMLSTTKIRDFALQLSQYEGFHGSEKALIQLFL